MSLLEKIAHYEFLATLADAQGRWCDAAEFRAYVAQLRRRALAL